jgi:hypothetical protein
MEALQRGYSVKLSLFLKCNFHELGINFYYAKIKWNFLSEIIKTMPIM